MGNYGYKPVPKKFQHRSSPATSNPGLPVVCRCKFSRSALLDLGLIRIPDTKILVNEAMVFGKRPAILGILGVGAVERREAFLTLRRPPPSLRLTCSAVEVGDDQSPASACGRQLR
jgi:hypothetical protein